MTLTTTEAMLVLMDIASSDHPLQEAIEIRVRWRYLLGVARAAEQGLKLDTSLPQVYREPQVIIDRAVPILDALDGWIAQQIAA